MTSHSSPWREVSASVSLPEVHSSLPVPRSPNFLRKLVAFAGPGFLVAVGYMDPGNWATDLAAGSRFNYSLLSVVLLSSVLAILLQSLALKLGIVAERDLAQECRDSYSRPTAFGLWLLAELAIAACDLAEVIGSAIALQLLFHIPLIIGVCITVGDVLLMLLLQQRGFRYIEAIVVTLILTISVCFGLEMFYSRPEMAGILASLLPAKEMVTNREMLYLAVGILGATVMPHNLYLHSAIVQTRDFERTTEGKREALKYCNIDSAIALSFAFVVNAAILILAAAAFYRTGHHAVAEIEDAYKLLSPVLGVGGASLLFAIALLASGQNSTLTGTLAGQVIMEGFLRIRLKPWLRRLITRLIAVVPAIIVTYLYGQSGTAKLLILSQVILSMQLSFAVFPLVAFTSSRKKMGEFANRGWLKVLAWAAAILIAGLNGWLLLATFGQWHH